MGHMQLVPWHANTDENKSCKVQNCLNGWIEWIMSCFGFGMVEAIPVQSASSNETGESLIRPKTAARPHDEQLSID